MIHNSKSSSPVGEILLNLGCGSRVHPAFVNLDVSPRVSGVVKWDANKGIPFENESVDLIYHSHVLEHLDRQQGRDFIGECFRVLKAGGILRVVVPDLEEVCRAYLSAVDSCDREPSEKNAKFHDWLIVELIDQLCRQQQGGEFKRQHQNADEDIRLLIESRLGKRPFQTREPAPPPYHSLFERIINSVVFRSKRYARMAVGTWMKHPKYAVGEFRTSGESHLWMYDRLSLRRLLESAGFSDVYRCDAFQSRRSDWMTMNLDMDGQVAARPNSIYLEAVK